MSTKPVITKSSRGGRTFHVLGRITDASGHGQILDSLEEMMETYSWTKQELVLTAFTELHKSYLGSKGAIAPVQPQTPLMVNEMYSVLRQTQRMVAETLRALQAGGINLSTSTVAQQLQDFDTQLGTLATVAEAFGGDLVMSDALEEEMDWQ